jgi:hypothetical protein
VLVVGAGAGNELVGALLTARRAASGITPAA